MSRNHDAAKACALAGIPIFPCRAFGKRPACANGYLDATTDLEQINAWWAENPDYNIACPPDRVGWCVIDADGTDGLANAGALHLPPTYTVRTPRGGEHRYYAGSLPSSTSKLAIHVDTRGRGGYVLLPPSRVVDEQEGIDGEYEVISDREIASLPQPLADRLASNRAPTLAADVELDERGNIARARDLLRTLASRGDVAVSGRGGNNRTYQLAAEILNLGLTPETAAGLILDIWNPACTPPWSDHELKELVEHAAQYAQNEPGAWAVPPAAEVFGQAQAPPEKRSRFYPRDFHDLKNLPDPKWIVRDRIAENTIVLLTADKGSFKSFIAQHTGLGVASGTETLGARPEAIGPVFYGAHEGLVDLGKIHQRAWRVAHEIDDEHRIEFYTMAGPRVSVESEGEDFGNEIKRKCDVLGRGPRLIVLDTYSACMLGLDENHPGDANKFIYYCRTLIEAFPGVAVVVPSHFGKDKARGTRGTNALEAGVDTLLTMQRIEHTKLVSLRVRNHRGFAEREAPWHFEGRTIAGSLAFFPTTAQAISEHAAESDLFAPARIGAALRQLGATHEASVTSQVLASTLVPPVQEQNDDERTRTIAHAEHMLRRLARDRLAAYCERDGRVLTWFLPN